MTREDLLDAIGQLDDELVLEAAAPAGRSVPWGKMAGWAAAFLLCVGIAGVSGERLESGVGTDAAAPEAETAVDDVLKDKGFLEDGAMDYEYSVGQESQAQEPSAAMREDSKNAGGTSQGIMQPQFFTERGVYLWVAPPLQQMSLPEGAKALGTLVEYRYDESNYPAVRARELVGCPVWESADGEQLYIQKSDGYWLIAQLIK